MKAGIYKIECLSSGRSYIGCSKDIDLRWKQHESKLRRGSHGNHILQSVYNKYNNLQYSIIELCEECFLFVREKYYISITPNNMNIMEPGGIPESKKKSTNYERQESDYMNLIHREISPYGIDISIAVNDENVNMAVCLRIIQLYRYMQKKKKKHLALIEYQHYKQIEEKGFV